MCVDCGPIESNTGVIQYSGPNLVLCSGVTITNGELLTSVIAKIDNCIGVLQNELDITGLVENSPCINLTKTSLQTVLQSILNTESAFCTQLEALETKITDLENQINNSSTNKTINVTACNGVTVVETSTSKTFQLGAFVPKKTILPYFGSISDFFTSGLGKPDAGLNGWAIADGRNGTINACGRYLKYSCEGCCQTGGSNEIRLEDFNIPEIVFDVNADFTLSGETEEAGRHRHITRNLENATADPLIPEDGELPVRNPNLFIETSGPAGVAQASQMGYNGLHTHTFNAQAVGSFSAIVGNNNPTPITIEPEYIAGIPIQYIGGC